MSDDDIRRIADAIEKMVSLNKNDSPWEIIAEVHEYYGSELLNILDNSSNSFDTARLLRGLQQRARSTANEIRTRMV